MIPELIRFAALCVGGVIVLCCLAERVTLEDYSEKRHVDKLADRSRKRKAPTARKVCRYAVSMWRPDKGQRKEAALH